MPPLITCNSGQHFRVIVNCFLFDGIVLAMLLAHGIWRETVSLLDVMWPWTSPWMGTLYREKRQLYNKCLHTLLIFREENNTPKSFPAHEHGLFDLKSNTPTISPLCLPFNSLTVKRNQFVISRKHDRSSSLTWSIVTCTVDLTSYFTSLNDRQVRAFFSVISCLTPAFSIPKLNTSRSFLTVSNHF